MKRVGRFLLRLMLLVLIIIGLGIGAYFGEQWYQNVSFQHDRPVVVKAKDGTNVNAAWQKLSTYQRKLRENYSFINKVTNYVPPRTWVGKDVVIPGLVTTKSYDFKNRRWNTATAMTPQGIAIAHHYLLLTAYDGDHRHASVIYVLNKKTGRYLKTVQVRGRPHLGGIAYDPVAKKVWVTGSLGSSSALMSFSLRSLEHYRSSSRLPIRYRDQISIPTIGKASTVTYADGQLFVGFFNMYGRGRVAAYPIARSGKQRGSITNNEIKSVTGTVDWSNPSGTASMAKQIQGIAIADDKIFLSQSYGSKDSKLYVFPMTALNALSEKNASLVIDLPPYLEQVTAYRGQLLCVFESGSRLYARPHLMIMDRILSLNINALFGD